MPDESQDWVSPSLADYWAIVWRRRWWILIPAFLCWVLFWGAGWLLPNTYQSEALILVEQQKVPEHYVVPNVTIRLQDRLQSMTQQILSRTRLQATIDRFHLYPPRRGASRLLQTGDPVEQMRKDIKIDLVAAPGHPEDLTAFRIYYSADSTQLAQQVNSELTSLFIDENLKAQQQLSESTTAFLENQLSTARTELEAQEAKVRAFKATHFGNLPSELQSNVQILTGLQAQLDGYQRALDGAKQQKLYLESLLQQYQSVEANLGTGDASAPSPQTLDKELLDLREKLADAQSLYTDDHPDIVALKDKITEREKLKQTIENEKAASPEADKSSSAKSSEGAQRAEPASSAPMMQIRSQLKANELEIQNYEPHARKIESDIETYRARLNLTPQVEQELADISRGYEESNANYNSLLQKQKQSQLATSLEQRQQGEQFRILDPPSLPDKPLAPNHLQISLGGLALGLALGCGLTALLELNNVRVRQEKQLEELVPAPVLVGIPHLSLPGEGRLRLLFRCLELGTAAAMIMSIVAGNVYTFYRG
jgi:succinoglycan biosynthesis transport protein ExoP